MSGFSFSHLTRPQVLSVYWETKASHRSADAVLLALVAEIDDRKLYLDAGYPSMHAFCLGEFDATHDEAKNRIRAARIARRFPAMFPMLADGRLQMTVVLLLSRYLNPGNVEELIEAAANKSKLDVRKLLAARFSRTELMSWTMGAVDNTSPVGSAPPRSILQTNAEQESQTVGVPERLGMTSQAASSENTALPSAIAPAPEAAAVSPERSVSDGGTTAVPLRVAPSLAVSRPQTRVTPIAANAHGVQFMMDDEANADLEYLRAALGHKAPTDGHVFVLALKALRREVDKRRSAATSRPRQPRSVASADPRHVPNHVRRAVWKRDQHRCTFVSANGRRCSARSDLELDHILPVAHGGSSTVDNLRLLCRAHNQHAADQVLGPAFMNGKRKEAQRRRERRRAS